MLNDSISAENDFHYLCLRQFKDRYTQSLSAARPGSLNMQQMRGIRVVRGLWWSNQQEWYSTCVVPSLYLVAIYPYLLVPCRVFATSSRAVHIQSKDDFIGATFAAKILGITVVWTDHADLKHIWRNLRIMVYKNPVGKWVYVAAHLTNSITVISRSEQSEVTAHLPKHSQVKSRILMVNNGAPDVRDQYTTITGVRLRFAQRTASCATRALVK